MDRFKLTNGQIAEMRTEEGLKILTSRPQHVSEHLEAFGLSQEISAPVCCQLKEVRFASPKSMTAHHFGDFVMLNIHLPKGSAMVLMREECEPDVFEFKNVDATLNDGILTVGEDCYGVPADDAETGGET